MLSIDRRACRNCRGRGDSDKVLTGKVTLTHLQLLVRSMLVQDVWPVTSALRAGFGIPKINNENNNK